MAEAERFFPSGFSVNGVNYKKVRELPRFQMKPENIA
jgi:hypothetical protein